MVSRSSIRSEWKTMMRLGRQSKNQNEASLECASFKRPNKGNIYINSKLRDKYGDCSAVFGAIGKNFVYAVTRQHDGAIFAVKRFGRRHETEDEDIYRKKILGEFFLGSQLRHTHIIKVFELFEEQNHWEQVMEYAPYSLFDRACSKMSLAEIDCSFKQIVAGVAYLHTMNLAHRDLKLENVVYTHEGVLKLIDFGTAAITAVRGSDLPVLVNDFVGSGPYIAPEVLSRNLYNPKVADIWSLAIMYCCMFMGKFPWMLAQYSDNAFARFASLQLLQSRTDQVSSDLTFRSCGTVTFTTQKIAAKSSASIICTITEAKDGHDDAKIARGRPEAWGGLSQGSWEAISSLLQIDCHRRGDLQQLTGSPWFKQIQVCCWEDGNGSVSGCTHQHV